MKGNSPFQRIIMHTGLSGFSLLSRIGEFSGEGICAYADLQNAPSYLGVEALAQAGAYHVRFLCGFERQAVLLVIRDCRLPAIETLSGCCELTGRLRSRSASAFAYGMSAAIGGSKVLEGEFVFSAVPYDSDLREDILRSYYEKKWTDLLNG
ncbi:MAG: hypothetical protein A4E72_00808 [Syntrophus sp. PtaU1.Bin208]|nr:MAG: hypothetical protein A4E72_00808 [Syntrophus sp. PtaU1.Bin208]